MVSMGRKRLPPELDQMAGEIGDQLDIGPCPVEDDVVDMTHILLDKRKQQREARPWITCIGKLYNDAQRLLRDRRILPVFNRRLT